MCGIFGSVSNQNVVSSLIEGLFSLEYRGYDSCGIAILNNKIKVYKTLGEVKNLSSKIDKNISSNCGIAHTRWATHGGCTILNCHPHFSFDKKIALVHNGTISNYLEIKEKLLSLEEGITFTGETDSEVVANLIAYYFLKTRSILGALKNATKLIKGSYAIAFIVENKKDTIFFARSFMPLYISFNEGTSYLGSDLYALPESSKYFEVLDNTFGYMNANEYRAFNLKKEIIYENIENDFERSSLSLNGYSSFMEKELNEISSIQKLLVEKYKNFKILKTIQRLVKNKKIIFIGCGTSYNACVFAKRFFLNDVMCFVASSFNDENIKISNKNIYFVISQSGETADVLRAIQKIRKHKCKLISICNNSKSSIARASDYNLDICCGKEVSVASTKCYYATISLLYILSTFKRKDFSTNNIHNFIKRLENSTNDLLKIKELAHNLEKAQTIYFVGRKDDYDLLKEVALKLQEVCYINCLVFLGGELKHGPIALLNDESYVICFNTNNLMNVNIEEIKSRKAKIYIFGEANDNVNKNEINFKFNSMYEKIYLVYLMHYLTFYLASLKGLNVDKPRNLAKCVTVD
ncbi:MAG: glutamine--fructose-6-phosphate transaminase (isomerizing) [Bacilli bacterium]